MTKCNSNLIVLLLYVYAFWFHLFCVGFVVLLTRFLLGILFFSCCRWRHCFLLFLLNIEFSSCSVAINFFSIQEY